MPLLGIIVGKFSTWPAQSSLHTMAATPGGSHTICLRNTKMFDSRISNTKDACIVIYKYTWLAGFR